MHKIALLICLALTAGAASAAGLTDLEMVGRYAELERAAEAKLATLQQPNTSVLAPLCIAYSRVKRYGKLFACLDRLENKWKLLAINPRRTFPSLPRRRSPRHRQWQSTSHQRNKCDRAPDQ